MENKEAVNFCCYQNISAIIAALKLGFFRGAYVCTFPKLLVGDCENNYYVVDMDSAFLLESREKAAED